MDPMRRLLANARAFIAGMAPSQKLLVASLAVIGAMALFLVTQYTGRPTMVELLPEGEAASNRATLVALKSAGIPAEVDPSGRLVVQAQYRDRALSELAESGNLPNDTTLLFRNLLDSQKFYSSKQQNDQAFMIALQNELAKMIRGFSNVRDASVVIDAPVARGIGKIVPQPTAVATVFTHGDRPLDQGTVDAVGELIAGAKAGLRLQNVRVIDGSVGRQRRPTDPDQAVATTYLEQAASVEATVQRKLSDMLAYIPGVTIAVTAHVDVTRVNEQETRYFNQEQGSAAVLKRSVNDSTIQSDSRAAAEPGVRPNAQAEIGASRSGATTSLEEEGGEKEFETAIGSQTRTTQDPRGYPTRLAASINVPRAYIVGLLKAADPAAEPDAAAIDQRFLDEQQKIADSVLPHLITQNETAAETPPDPAERVVVSLISTDLALPGMSEAGLGMLGGLASGSGGGGLLGGGLVEKGTLAFLAVGAMGMMLMMVRKATRPLEVPTPEELSGVPPTLPTVDDMVGEAEESEAPMTGIEVGDAEIRTRKLLEQVEELVGANPEGTASLLGRWIVDER